MDYWSCNFLYPDLSGNMASFQISWDSRRNPTRRPFVSPRLSSRAPMMAGRFRHKISMPSSNLTKQPSLVIWLDATPSKSSYGMVFAFLELCHATAFLMCFCIFSGWQRPTPSLRHGPFLLWTVIHHLV